MFGFGAPRPGQYQPVEDTEEVLKSGTSETIKTKYQCITLMKEYQNKSLEELRLEDYKAGRKCNGLFCSSQQWPAGNDQWFHLSRSEFPQKRAAAASNRVVHTIAKHGKLFTDADGEFIRDCMIAAAEEICPEKAHLFENIPLSPDTLEQRVYHIREEISSELLLKTLQTEWFSLALEESTDLSDTTHVLLFIRGITSRFAVYEELLDVFSIHGKTTGEDIFKGVENAITQTKLSWKQLKCIDTDLGRNMCEENKGVVALVSKAVVKDGGKKPLVVHGIIHKHSLCGKCLDMSEVLKPVISAVNFIRSELRECFEGTGVTQPNDDDDTAAHRRKLVEFIKELGDADLPYYTEVSWLICGKVLKRFFELRTSIKSFLNEKNRPLAELEDMTWLWKLSFYTDLTVHMNGFIFKLQQENQYLSDLYNHIKSFIKELMCFKYYYHYTPYRYGYPVWKNANTCREFDIQTPELFPRNFCIKALEGLKINLESRCNANEIAKEMNLFQNPFQGSPSIEDHGPQLVKEINYIQNTNFDQLYKNEFSTNTLMNFYEGLSFLHPELRNFARSIFSGFGSTNLIEKTVSKLKVVKNTYTPELLTDKYLKNLLIMSTSEIHMQHARKNFNI